MNQPVHHLRCYLEHPWRFQRQIVHHDTGQMVNVSGTVSWQDVSEPSPVPTLLYMEAGVIQLTNYTGNASLTYRYVFPREAVAEVYFRDGRFFLHLRPDDEPL